MKKAIFLILIFMLLATVGCAADKSATNAQAQGVELIVAAAASLTDVTAEVADAYAKIAPNVTLTFTYASSGSLQTQIEQSAPIDIFMSAAQKQMNALEAQSLLLKDTRVDLLENKVVLIAPADTQLEITSFEDLADESIQTVAYGDPASVPAGQYAYEVLTSLGIAEAISHKANLGNDVRQVLTWVERSEVDCGIVYATDAATSDKIQIVCEAPEGSVKQIVYPAAVLASTSQEREAKAFIDFLQSAECAAIFEAYGFAIAEK